MTESETTPKKQTRLEWSLKKGASREEVGEEGSEEEKPFAEVSPFKKLEEKMNTEQFQGFKRKLESEREEKVREQKVHSCFLLE